MKVYVVEAGVYSDRYIEGVYATPESAMAANPGGKWEHSEGEYGGERWQRWGNDLDWDSARSIAEYDVPAPDSIDAAWSEAEAALPAGGRIDRLNRNGPKDWTAYASEAPHLGMEMGAHNTPAAALRALAEKLRERTG